MGTLFNQKILIFIQGKKPYLNTNIIIHMIHQFISAEPPKRKRSSSSPSSGSAKTTLRFKISESCNGQRGWSEIIKIEILEGSPESAERAFEVMAQYNESKFSCLRSFKAWAIHGERGGPPPPMPDRLPAFFALSLAKAKFPGKTACEEDTKVERRPVTHRVTLTFGTKWEELGHRARH